jgi:hypothetical protein
VTDGPAETVLDRLPDLVVVGLSKAGTTSLFDYLVERPAAVMDGYYALNRAAPAESMSATARDRLDVFYRPHNARLAEQHAPLGLALLAGWS